MSDFPRTSIGGLSVSRLVIGTNWFLGFSHKSVAKDGVINSNATREMIASILEAFLREGVDTMIGTRPNKRLVSAIKDAEDRVGRGIIGIATPHFNEIHGPGLVDEVKRAADDYARVGCKVLMPHQCTTDTLLDKMSRTIRRGDEIMRAIRERGLIPGLSNHSPEAVLYADESGLDVETYLEIYNCLGFLMQVEIEWVHRVIHRAKKPVLTIKPMAAGRVTPLAGLAFAWSTIRDRDMVAVGTMSPDEAKECIEISRSLLDRRAPEVELQKTRSKKSLEPKE
ncbi:MAG: aldo-keto reductase family protein [Planctomycetota bacterium]|jgi:hypothetical protein